MCHLYIILMCTVTLHVSFVYFSPTGMWVLLRWHFILENLNRTSLGGENWLNKVKMYNHDNNFGKIFFLAASTIFPPIVFMLACSEVISREAKWKWDGIYIFNRQNHQQQMHKGNGKICILRCCPILGKHPFWELQGLGGGMRWVEMVEKSSFLHLITTQINHCGATSYKANSRKRQLI